jgi:hypothetical protein
MPHHGVVCKWDHKPFGLSHPELMKWRSDAMHISFKLEFRHHLSNLDNFASQCKSFEKAGLSSNEQNIVVPWKLNFVNIHLWLYLIIRIPNKFMSHPPPELKVGSRISHREWLNHRYLTLVQIWINEI